MTKENKKQEKTFYRNNFQNELSISLVIGLILLAGLVTLSGCGKSSANGSNNASPNPGTIVKNSGGMEFAYVPAGSFQMGADHGLERPMHQVTFAKGFYLGRFEVTQAQWQKVMGSNPSAPSGDCTDNCPVDRVTWNDAQEFVKRLNAQNDGFQYHLPSEAEWEYACRAGTTGDYAGDLNSMAWYDDNSDKTVHPVGQKQANAWGLYDMHGNVSEWVMDINHDSYQGAPTDGAAWTSGGDQNIRVIRGGRRSSLAGDLRSAAREIFSPDTGGNGFGLRVAAMPRL